MERDVRMSNDRAAREPPERIALEPCHLDHFIGGASRGSSGGGRLAVTSPATGEALGSVPAGTREDVAAAAWGALDPLEREGTRYG